MVRANNTKNFKPDCRLPVILPISSEDRVYFSPHDGMSFPPNHDSVSLSKVYEKLWIFDMGAYDIEEMLRGEVLW